MATALFTTLDKCLTCKNVSIRKDTRVHTASVWNGSEWLQVRHGDKRCPSCRVYYKLNYVAVNNSKMNTLKTVEDDSIILLNHHLGFTYKYLNNYWFRVCRAHTSALAEASSILQSQPNASIGHVAKQESNTKHRDNWLMRLILQGMFIYLRLKENTFDFDVDDPVPSGDKLYDTPLKEAHFIFDATTDDPDFIVKGKLDVVTDGNRPLARKLCDDEKKDLKRLQGRPKKKLKKSTSRCKAVAIVENLQISRHSIGGLFATMNMKKTKQDQRERSGTTG